MALLIDLNCDLGEGCGHDAELMPLISSANIACGFHAGDRDTMRRTVELAVENGVAVGAHPGYPDRENFGRTEMNLSGQEIFEIVTEQINELREIAQSFGQKLHHVKPHGALYNQAATDGSLAAAIAEAVKAADRNLVLFGLSGSVSISEAEKLGLRTASEVFADRTYQANGSLTPRSMPNALIENGDDAIRQVLGFVNSGSVTAITGEVVPLRCDTICIHGDGAHAISFAKKIHAALLQNGVAISAFR